MDPALAVMVLAEYRCEQYDRSGTCFERHGEMIPAPWRAPDCTRYAGRVYREARERLYAIASADEQRSAKGEAERLIRSVPWGSPELDRIIEEAKAVAGGGD